MATRANIVIKDRDGVEVVLYHHFDGYPEGVGEELKMFLRHLTDECCDAEHLATYICLQDRAYSLSEGIHGDIDYLYTIDMGGGTLHCRDCNSGAETLMCRFEPIAGTMEAARRLLIQTRLGLLEAEYDIRILLAVEAGSRAWGFSSPDSDWDVRFIYVHRPQWYLRVEPGRDSIERTFEEEALDFAGWDLRKALSLSRKTNPSLLEWLHSPIIYRQDVRFVDAMWHLERQSFNPIKAIHHYFSIARGHDEKYLQRDGFTLKRFLYYLRGLLSCVWIERKMCTPPVRFGELTAATVADAVVLEAIEGLLKLKRESKEHDKSVVAPILIEFTEGLRRYYESMLPVFRPELPPRTDISAQMDRLLFDCAMKFGAQRKNF